MGGHNCENANTPCPTSDPKYSWVNGKCLYFEKTSMNYEDAKSNCANKMARYGKGRLFEPKSHNMSEMVAAKANETFGDLEISTRRHAFRIGVNDIVQPDTYV